MPPIGGGGPDSKVRERLEDLVALTRASLSWHWRLLAIIVTLATVVSVIFQALSYFYR